MVRHTLVLRVYVEKADLTIRTQRNFFDIILWHVDVAVLFQSTTKSARKVLESSHEVWE